ncbi:transglycosylase domain-containing protein [Oceaniglobus indicus]|uniref:transglycosylase domain-containing protein n=1 Tax=Oceaniglobus indicus TaxID=2047749 RepID=UPI000C1A3EF0|nr:PBP1A family penicillin-binding protein [Oceaniglobus indicus]
MAGSGNRRPPLVADRRRKAKPAAKSKAKATPRRAAKSRRTKVRRGPIGWLVALVRWILSLIWLLVWRSTAVVVLLIGLGVFYYYTTLPPVENLLDARARGSVTLLDRDGRTFAWRGEQYSQLTADSVSPYLKNAVIATEDKRFYRHFGVSPRGVASAVKINLSEGRGPLSGHGGSTITQQTAKLLCMGQPFDPAEWKDEAAYEADCREGSLWRKITEAVYAMAMEARYTKDEILTIYLNRAFLGAGSRGFDAAAQRYFGKSAAKVDAAEAAMLAGLLVAPSRFAPTNDLERSQNRARVIIGLMAEQGYITNAEAAEARANPATLSAAAEARAGGYFADWVMETGPDFLTRDTTEDVILSTTFDARLQRAAEEALDHIFKTKVREGSKAQAAIVVMSADGAVRAMVGGRRFKGVVGQFNRAVMANRQTGSAFKPFVFAAALELGYTGNDRVLDEPLTMQIPGSGAWSPKNYDGKYRGSASLTDALKYSLNIPAIHVAEAVGRENVRRVAEDFGIKSDLAAGPALALGASESTLIEMTGAYAGILNGGTSVRPYGLRELRLKGDDTPLIGQEGGLGERVISQDAAEQLTWMMHQVVEGGTGTRARIPGREVAGKTGTTQAARDAWFLGFSAHYVTGVWMGYDDNTPLTGVTGGGLPAEIWQDVMSRIEADLPADPLPMRPPPAPVAQPAPAPYQDNGASSGNVPQPVPQQPAQPARQPDMAERILNEVLGGLLGRPQN